MDGHFLQTQLFCRSETEVADDDDVVRIDHNGLPETVFANAGGHLVHGRSAPFTRILRIRLGSINRPLFNQHFVNLDIYLALLPPHPQTCAFLYDGSPLVVVGPCQRMRSPYRSQIRVRLSAPTPAKTSAPPSFRPRRLL